MSLDRKTQEGGIEAGKLRWKQHLPFPNECSRREETQFFSDFWKDIFADI